jgi:hypothetical protein
MRRGKKIPPVIFLAHFCSLANHVAMWVLETRNCELLGACS